MLWKSALFVILVRTWSVVEDKEYRPATRAADRGRQSLKVIDTISVLQKCTQHQSPELLNIFKRNYKGLSAEPAQKLVRCHPRHVGVTCVVSSEPRYHHKSGVATVT